ncbi:hypothetical protein CMQ_1890 [Grosmannia clavigera kw1407]|uniref:Uncharacterized protein n=1 Tax=Grosmannia clavigera (strain kw1407 / UAMH 11150) TaxID=655863 RepID=F0XN20_GROCL|nr:uncharacterized protein CMQ_1890 [Grosmannia clavigera kw1407]EFX00809.1 hypothetical protein CMQ_1890 [Grosmannia clavigera kw1407]
MLLQSQPANSTMPAGLTRHSKRKAVDSLDNNERLSKRLSLLNIEQSGTRIYAPVASTRSPVEHQPVPSSSFHETLHGQNQSALPDAAQYPPARAFFETVAAPAVPVPPSRTADESSDMQVDDTKFKVYIHNIDDELASGSDSDGDGDGKLVFLPHVNKHLRDAARSNAGFVPAIPRPIRVNEDGELAGMQLVLYNDPSSLSVAPEHDSVRQAILDARARIRERQRGQCLDSPQGPSSPGVSDMTDEESSSMLQSPARFDDDDDAMEMD